MAAVVSQLSSLGSRLLSCHASHSSASLLLHRLTSPLLCAVSLAITAIRVFGDPIRCYTTGGMDIKFMEEYCWAMSTYSVEAATSTYPGLGLNQGRRSYHSHYQFLPLFLFLLAGACCLPMALWRVWEGGLTSRLLPTTLDTLDWQKVRAYCGTIAAYFGRNQGSRHHGTFGRVFILTDILCLATLLLVVGLLHLLLGDFLLYLPKYLEHLVGEGTEPGPEERIFPLLTKCSYSTTGYSGSHQSIDALCILGDNLFYRKAVLGVWAWLALATTTCTFLVVLTALHLLPPLRRRRLSQLVAHRLDPLLVAAMERSLTYGDWLVLTRLAGALPPDVASLLIETVANKLTTRGEKLGGRRRKELEKVGKGKNERRVGGRMF